MTCAMQILARVHTTAANSPEANRYIMDCDPGAMDREPTPTTADIKQAKHFANGGDAITFWRTQSRVRPLRSDGKPNRPLTAFSVEIVPV